MPRDNRRSPEAAEYRRLYKTARWIKLRNAHKAKEPLCRYCMQQGRAVPMAVVDHIRPHNGNEALFFDPSNLQSLCRPHHDATKQAEERGGRVLGSGLDGRPTDPAHPWNTIP
jgi:5-methylcytosine-specific restriction endonuclease McrA